MAVGRLSYQLPVILALFLAIAFTVAVEYTFKRLANVLNFSILGVHPLANVAHAIEATIVEGCQDAIGHLESWALSLLNDMKAAFEFLFAIVALIVAGIVWVAAYTYRQSVSQWTNFYDTLIHPVADEALIKARSALARLDKLDTAIGARIATASSAVYQTVTHEWRIALRDAGIQTWAGIDEVVKDLRAEFEARLKGIEGTTTTVTGTLDAATEKAIQAISDAEKATANELTDLLNNVTPGDIAALIASVPILTALVQTLTTETGLSNAECRAKLKGVCGTDLGRWLNFLEGLALAFTWTSLDDFANELADLTGDVTNQITEFIGV